MNCDICSELQKDRRAYFHSIYKSRLPERILYDSKNFFVMPSIGQMIEGYLLIVPKHHYLSIGQMPEVLIAEVEAIKDYVSKQLTRLYGPPIFFEHGPIREAGGCGVYHAHLHAVPCGQLHGILDRISKDFEIKRTDSLVELREYVAMNESYVYFEDITGEKYSFVVDEIPSQYFRRLIAELMNNTRWDWRSYRYNNDKLSETFFKMKVALEPHSAI